MRNLLNSRGDTLVEVAIALSIVSTVLVSAILLSTKAVQVGIASRERSQAAQLLQQQAEGLRSLRDNTDWVTFTASIPAGAFHVESFEPSPGVHRWRFAPGALSPIIDGQPTVFTLDIVSDNPPPNADQRNFQITASWDRIGGGPQEQSTLYTHLSNRNFIISEAGSASHVAILVGTLNKQSKRLQKRVIV